MRGADVAGWLLVAAIALPLPVVVLCCISGAGMSLWTAVQ